jgi:hypothetical protein
MFRIMPIKRHCIPAICAIVLLAPCGCGGGGPERPDLAAVSGTVVYDGQPLAGAEVAFWADKAPKASIGVTNSEGKFQLTMFDLNDGAMPGENVITVTKRVATAAPSSSDMEAMLNDPTTMTAAMQAEDEPGEKQEAKSDIPAKYSEKGTTPLKETVSTSGNNEFVLQLAVE